MILIIRYTKIPRERVSIVFVNVTPVYALKYRCVYKLTILLLHKNLPPLHFTFVHAHIFRFFYSLWYLFNDYSYSQKKIKESK